MSEWIHLRAQNDTYGNPRRLYVEIEEGYIVSVVDEGYRGIQAARAAGMPPTYSPCFFDISAGEYHAVKTAVLSPRKDATYQGYRNYETFSVDISLSNDEEQYNAVREIVQEGGRTRDTAHALRAYVESLPGGEVLESATLAGTLANSAFDNVDWRELVNLWANRLNEE